MIFRNLFLATSMTLAACGGGEEKFNAYEVTPTASLTEEETAGLAEGCTKIVRGLGTYSSEDDCKTHLANYTQVEGREYHCLKEKKSMSCK